VNYSIHNCKQGNEAWQQLRLARLTASDAQAIATAGVGLDTLVLKKVAEKLTGKAPEGYTNGDMERGHELEMMARNAYELETGNLVKEVGFCELDEYTGCSPDGFIGEDGLVEIKCKADHTFVQAMLDHKPEAGHFWQVQMQMWITERKWCDYVVFNPNFPKPLIVIRVDRDEKSIEKIKAGVEKGKALIKSYLEKLNDK
jgi:hypothetical protein